MIGLSLNLRNLAASQVNAYGFNSYASLGGFLFAADGSGLYQLDDGADAAGTDIDAFFEFVHDFGRVTRLKRVVIGGEFSGGLTVTLTVDETTSKTYAVTPDKTGNAQHRFAFPVRRDQGQGRYWTFKIANTDGADFSVDTIAVHPIYKTLR
jgi:hypothetical protein